MILDLSDYGCLLVKTSIAEMANSLRELKEWEFVYPFNIYGMEMESREDIEDKISTLEWIHLRMVRGDSEICL